MKVYTRDPATNSEFTPENGWLEDEFPFGRLPIFRCKLLVTVSGGVMVFCGIPYLKILVLTVPRRGANPTYRWTQTA